MWYDIKDQCFGAPYRGFSMGYVIRSTDTTSLTGIRHLVFVNLTSEDLPDSTIDSSVFVRAAELETYKLLEISGDTGYSSKIGITQTRLEFPRTFAYRGAWASGTAYVQNDIVYSGSNLYYAKSGFTSTTAISLSNWQLIQVNFRGIWATGTLYQVNDIVENSNRLYYANSRFTAPAVFTSGNWTEIVSPVVQTNAQRLSEERIKIAVQYLTAIKIIPALPQLLEEQILRERVRYQEIDWEKRIELYQAEVTDALEEETTTTIFADGTAVYGEITQYLAL